MHFRKSVKIHTLYVEKYTRELPTGRMHIITNKVFFAIFLLFSFFLRSIEL